jgi:small-conductance mechanosensitive channel
MATEITIKRTVNVPKEVDLTINIPSFWKYGTISVYKMTGPESYVEVDTFGDASVKIRTNYTTLTEYIVTGKVVECTESEFTEAYNKAMEAIKNAITNQ